MDAEAPHADSRGVSWHAGEGTPCEGAPTLRVLASSSRGNCSALHLPAWGGAPERVILLDAGLSPRRTAKLLSACGLRVEDVAGVVLTHLDHDHWNEGWLAALAPEIPVYVFRGHRGRADRMGITYRRTEVFADSFSPSPGVTFHAEPAAHDDLGSVAFRVVVRRDGWAAHLGYATDLGSAPAQLCEHLRDVDVLAIESNYCPRLQAASARPEFLKRRIMGGYGHLSNQESARAVARACPASAVVLLHLSLECNTPETALAAHTHPGLQVRVARWDGPIDPVRVRPARARAGQGAGGARLRPELDRMNLWEASASIPLAPHG